MPHFLVRPSRNSRLGHAKSIRFGLTWENGPRPTLGHKRHLPGMVAWSASDLDSGGQLEAIAPRSGAGTAQGSDQLGLPAKCDLSHMVYPLDSVRSQDRGLYLFDPLARSEPSAQDSPRLGGIDKVAHGPP